MPPPLPPPLPPGALLLRGASPAAPERPASPRCTPQGALLLKHGRHGRPKVHYFRVCSCDTLLRWRSAGGSLKQVKLRCVSEVVAGQTTDVFRRHPVREPGGATRSLSLHYRDDDGSSRTLDLTCPDGPSFQLWHTGLAVLVRRLRAMGTPVTGAALQPPGAPQPLGAGCGPGGASPADVARCVERCWGMQARAAGAGGV